ncbi:MULTISPECIES: circadian clock-controlled protein [Clostridium]|nr:circadian clock-controlled protein [Clostridium sp.]MDU7085938.1 circadian clock-controlled protein [Clostridium sp.]MDU7362742.1 circadian clock-controlled protein [Clostridium sp.]
MARKITISFKETTKDIELYSYLISLEDKSTEIKDLIRKGLDKKSNN